MGAREGKQHEIIWRSWVGRESMCPGVACPSEKRLSQYEIHTCAEAEVNFFDFFGGAPLEGAWPASGARFLPLFLPMTSRRGTAWAVLGKLYGRDSIDSACGCGFLPSLLCVCVCVLPDLFSCFSWPTRTCSTITTSAVPYHVRQLAGVPPL